MRKEQRKEPRYKEVGRAECDAISALPGVLENISKSGLNVRFPNLAVINEDTVYTLRVTLSSGKVPRSLNLLCAPRWQKKGDNETRAGFSVLRSPDTPLLSDFIKSMEEKAKNAADSSDMLFDQSISFVE